MSAHCHDCGTDLVYSGEYPLMVCPVCELRAECERLAGRVAAYKSALEEIASHVVISEGEFPDDNCDWHCTLTMQARAKDVLADVGGSE